LLSAVGTVFSNIIGYYSLGR